MAKNIQSLQLLRNTSELYATRKDALTALTGGTIPAGTQDGTPVLARYKGTDNKIYTLVGYYAASSAITGGDSATSNMTVFDFEGNAADVEELKQKIGSGVTVENNVTKQLQDLSGNSATAQSGDTSVEGAKRYADEKVRAELDKLDYNLTKDDNKVVVSFEQIDGKISGTSENITSVKLGGYVEGTDADVAATDTLGEALGKLQAQINAMDKTASAVDGQVVTTVTEEDGKVTETKANVKDLQLGGYTKDTAATGDIASTDTINAALSKLENKAAAITIANDDKSINVTTSTTGTNINVNINSKEHVLAKDGDAGLYTNIALSSITPSSTTVKEEYQLTATDGSKLGETIKIYKDSSISKIYLGYPTDTVDAETGTITSGTTGEPQSLNYVYHKEDGKYEMVHIDVSKFLVESEFASGVTADATGVVHGVVDPTSEKNSGNTASFLTVGEDGFKVDGIKNEIINRINELDASVSGTSTVTEDTLSGHIRVVVDEADGKLTAVTVNEKNIADADKLVELSGKTVTEVASSNNSITAALSAATDGTKHLDIITDASKIKMTGFTSTDVLSGISATSSVTEAFKEVDKVITDNERVVSAALNDLDTTKVDVITVNGKQSKTPASGDVVASVTIDGADIKLDGYASGSSSAAVVATDTVNQAIGKLENQVKAAVAGGLQQVESGDGISVSSVANNKQTISVNLKKNVTTTGSEWENPLKFDATSKGLYFDSLDCGTY